MPVIQDITMSFSFLLPGFICSHLGLAHRNITGWVILDPVRICQNYASDQELGKKKYKEKE